MQQNYNTNLLVEFHSEEIPSAMQLGSYPKIRDLLSRQLDQRDIEFSKIKIFSSSCHFAMMIENIQKFLPARDEIVKGPKISSKNEIIDRFCKAHAIGKSQLEEYSISEDKPKIFIYRKHIKQAHISSIFSDIINDVLKQHKWPKSMLWGAYNMRWPRPLKNILCMADTDIVKIKIGHLESSDITYGHKFLSSNIIKIKNVSDYEMLLEKNFITASFEKRKAKIQNDIKEIMQLHDLSVKDDEALLSEVCSLVDWPKVCIGKIDSKFLSLPTEVIVTSMRKHQKYFACFRSDEKNAESLAPYFIFVSNMDLKDMSGIIKGNEKVLSARLEDAMFFYKTDLLSTMEQKRQMLKKVTFHEKLGSLYEKTERIKDLVGDFDDVAQLAAKYCKSDLCSLMVQEFPELQGIMGKYFADAENLENIGDMIKQHYLPLGPTSKLPSAESRIIALADKIDSLCGLIIAGHKPTGSKDPFSLRRMALGIIRILISTPEADTKYNLKNFVETSISLYANQTPELVGSKGHIFVDDILKFIEDRTRYYYKEKYNAYVVNAVVKIDLSTSMPYLDQKIKYLDSFCASKQGNDFLRLYKRLSNLVKDIEGNIDFSEDDFPEKSQKDLYNYFKKQSQIDLQKDFKILLEQDHTVISHFLDNNLINDPDNQKDSKIRCSILKKILKFYQKIVDFNEILPLIEIK